MEVAKGYLRAFEPDYLVEMTPGLANGLGFPQDRVLHEIGVVDPNRRDQIHCGVNVSELYRWLYEREYQFVRRHPEKVVLPEISGHGFQLLSAAWFGAFPPDDKLSYVRVNYRKGFGAEPLEITAANAFDYLLIGLVTPLQMGSRNSEVLGRKDWENLTLFVLNPAAPSDIIDYWNLRAVGWPIVPLPCGWAAQMVDACNELIKRAHSHNPWNPKVTYGTRLLKSRTLGKSEFDSVVHALSPNGYRMTVQHWYPAHVERLWTECRPRRPIGGDSQARSRRAQCRPFPTDLISGHRSRLPR